MCQRVVSFENQIRQHFDSYNTQIFSCYETYLDDLINSYVKTIRTRVKSASKEERLASLSCMLYVLLKTSISVASFLPYVAEYIYVSLKNITSSLNITILNQLPISVHLLNVNVNGFHTLSEHLVRECFADNLSEVAQLMHSIILVNRLRTENNLSLTRALSTVTFYTLNGANLKEGLQEFKERTNTLHTVFKVLNDNIANYTIKPNNKTIGEDFGKLAGKVKSLIMSMKIDNVLNGMYHNFEGKILDKKYFDIELGSNGSKKTTFADNKYFMIIELDTEETEEIKELLIVRMFTNSIQKFRKELGLKQWNKIEIYFTSEEKFTNTILKYINSITKKIENPVIHGNIPNEFESDAKMINKNIEGYITTIWIKIF